MFEDLRKIIIYEIRNRITGLSYIGATYNGFFGRVGQHFNRLINDKHVNKIFQKEWNKSDITDWSIRILEYNIPQGHGKEREEYWIKKRGGLNIMPKSCHQLRLEKYLKIALDLKGDLTYRQIAEKNNVALGTISRVARKFKMSRRYNTI